VAIDTVALQDWLINHVGTIVGTTAVLGHEPKKSIDYKGLNVDTVVAIWLNEIEALQMRGGLASTSARLTWVIRQHRNALGPAADMTASERQTLATADAILASFFSDIVITAAADAWFDPKGQTGEPVKGVTGFVEIDNQLNRVNTITVAMVVDDAWTEAL
jgi:hypothetical protein